MSDDLRRHQSEFLDRRRKIVGLNLLASGAMAVVAAYQTGLLERVPEPPLGVFDADRVDGSGEAYEFLKTPDAALGLISYAFTVALAGAGDDDRWKTHPLLPIALAAKVATDALGALYLTAEQATKHRRFCSWCLAASIATLATVPHVVPEARAAIGRIRRRPRRR